MTVVKRWKAILCWKEDSHILLHTLPLFAHFVTRIRTIQPTSFLAAQYKHHSHPGTSGPARRSARRCSASGNRGWPLPPRPPDPPDYDVRGVGDNHHHHDQGFIPPTITSPPATTERVQTRQLLTDITERGRNFPDVPIRTGRRTLNEKIVRCTVQCLADYKVSREDLAG